MNFENFTKKKTIELIEKAFQIQKKYWKGFIEPCGIVNAKSGLCNEDCKFCAQSIRYNTHVSQYSLLSPEEILQKAKVAQQNGAKRFGIVTSGKKPNSKELEKIALSIKLIKKNTSIMPCASLGNLTKDELKFLKENGLIRFHHNIETSREFYSKIVTTHTFEEKIKTIYYAAEVGLEVCSGGIIGMGESEKDRISFLYTLSQLPIKSIPINILIPIKGTPLENIKPLSLEEIIRTIAVARILNPNKVIKIAAGREKYLEGWESFIFLTMANGFITGDYLTIKGKTPQKDMELINIIKKLWTS